MTAITGMTEQEKILNTLINQKAECLKLVVTLKIQSKLEEADSVKGKALVLSAKIDDLLGKSMDEWVIDSKALLDDLTIANKEIKASIGQIKKAQKTAENVIKFLKNIDKVIEIASKILL